MVALAVVTVQKRHAQASFVEWKRAKNLQSRPIVSDPCCKERVVDLVIESGEDSSGDKGFRQGLSEILHTSIVGVFEQCHRSFCMKGPEDAFWGSIVCKMLFEPCHA